MAGGYPEGPFPATAAVFERNEARARHQARKNRRGLAGTIPVRAARPSASSRVVVTIGCGDRRNHVAPAALKHLLRRAPGRRDNDLDLRPAIWAFEELAVGKGRVLAERQSRGHDWVLLNPILFVAEMNVLPGRRRHVLPAAPDDLMGLLAGTRAGDLDLRPAIPANQPLPDFIFLRRPATDGLRLGGHEKTPFRMTSFEAPSLIFPAKRGPRWQLHASVDLWKLKITNLRFQIDY